MPSESLAALPQTANPTALFAQTALPQQILTPLFSFTSTLLLHSFAVCGKSWRFFSTACALFTENAGVYPPSHSPISISHFPFSNVFRINTYKTAICKLFRINTYEKTREGVGVAGLPQSTPGASADATFRVLNQLRPERQVPRRQQRVLPRIPPQEVIRLRMRRMVLPRFPHFVHQKRAGAIRGAMQIVLQAAVFLPRRRHQRAKLRLQKRLMPRARAHQHNQRHAILRQLRVMIRRAHFPRASTFSGSLLCFLLCHRGGIVLQKSPLASNTTSVRSEPLP